jgi:hypothetical protein
MAASGFTPIQLYSTSTASAAPSVGNLTNSTLGSELAINITDGKLFYKDNANAVQVIGWKVTPTTAGGTGLTSYTAGDLLYYATGTTLSKLGIGTNGQILKSTGSAPAWETVSNLAVTSITFGTTGLTPATATQGAVTVAGTLVAANGGTGQSSYAVGDLLYANTTTTLAKLADVATGNALISGGVSTAPSWGKIGLTTHVSGILPVANGGTNASTASITAFNNITGYSASGATGTTSTNLVFSTSPSITTPSVTGDLTMSTGNVVMSNGKGIDFSATSGTGTSELFADYEEGTWSPQLAGSVTAGTYTTVATQGLYTKIGRVVQFQMYLAWSGGTGTGDLLIKGLPFTQNATSDSTPTVGFCKNITLTALNVPFAYLYAGVSYITLWQNVVGGGSPTVVPYDAAGELILTGTYTT